jgi:predicted GNAT family N-acyltransferase
VSSQIDFSKYELIRLTEDYSIKPFDCNDGDLNDFLFNDAKNYFKELLAVTHIIEDRDNATTIAFFSMFNDKISLKDTSNNIWNRLRKEIPNPKRLSSYPAVKLGRLGVSNEYKGNGFGKMILDYLKVHFVTNNRTGCRFLTVDAYAGSLKFYEKQGFIYFSNTDIGKDTRQMYYDLARIPS